MKMNWRHCVIFLSVVALTSIAANSAHAEGARIGQAVIIKNEVLRDAEATPSQINVGDGVLRDETVRTGADSAARFVMLDSTNLSLGANASIKLDRTVFNDEHSYRDIAIRLTTGAFRFVTGHSEKTAYKITTPLATIGVRGTILDILSQRGQTTVVLQEGGASVCTLGFQCVQLTEPGDTVVVNLTGAGGKTKITKTSGNTPWTFASVCAASPGLCSVNDLADNTPPSGLDANGVLCGR
jgi:hypothetical protein